MTVRAKARATAPKSKFWFSEFASTGCLQDCTGTSAAICANHLYCLGSNDTSIALVFNDGKPQTSRKRETELTLPSVLQHLSPKVIGTIPYRSLTQ